MLTTTTTEKEFQGPKSEVWESKDLPRVRLQIIRDSSGRYLRSHYLNGPLKGELVQAPFKQLSDAYRRVDRCIEVSKP